MDEIDRAQEYEAIDRARAIESASRAGMPAIGTCHYCGDDVAPGHHFCNKECRDDFERQLAARRREGLHNAGGNATRSGRVD